MSNELVPVSTGSKFAFAAATLPTGAAVLRHRRGKFVTGDSELPIGTKVAVHDMVFGWLKFNGPGVPPTKIVAEPGQRLPERHELGDDDPTFWSMGPDGKTPSDPWTEFTESTVTEMFTGIQYALSATSPSARRAMGQLSRQIVWGQRTRGPNATPVIELRSHETDGVKGVYDVPDYPIADWITGEEDNNNNVLSFEQPAEDSAAKTAGRARAAATGLDRAQKALRQRLAKDKAGEMDDQVPF
jgi:hypothetical protein